MYASGDAVIKLIEALTDRHMVLVPFAFCTIAWSNEATIGAVQAAAVVAAATSTARECTRIPSCLSWNRPTSWRALCNTASKMNSGLRPRKGCGTDTTDGDMATSDMVTQETRSVQSSRVFVTTEKKTPVVRWGQPTLVERKEASRESCRCGKLAATW